MKRKTLGEIWDDITIEIEHIWHNIRGFYERIVGTLEYAKFIWKTNTYREWDYAYLYELMLFKLKRMATQLGHDTFVEGASKTESEIHHAVALLRMYFEVEDSTNDHNDAEAVRDIYYQQQRYWEKFHQYLSDNAQKWWS